VILLHNLSNKKKEEITKKTLLIKNAKLRFIISILWIFYSLRIDNQNLEKMQAKGYHNEEKEMCWWLFYKNNSQTNSLSYPEEPLRKLIPIISSRRPWLLTSCLHDHAIQIHQIEQLIMVRSRACPVQHKWLWLHYGSGSRNSSGYIFPDFIRLPLP
jgi:hypothetical protein